MAAGGDEGAVGAQRCAEQPIVGSLKLLDGIVGKVDPPQAAVARMKVKQIECIWLRWVMTRSS